MAMDYPALERAANQVTYACDVIHQVEFPRGDGMAEIDAKWAVAREAVWQLCIAVHKPLNARAQELLGGTNPEQSAGVR